ncbi:bifunctional nicotinamidase/pyrazinamidase [Steroidobacter denitrificans]|uniref:bifunctional nicotinamidase/pyrazinamidase n=1 Tax=Steroidobacter denitrificans TaxID=465721 RepID=UPI001AEF4B9C|nr:bifunctional nicotinamidase/pyrazinamidase [Steroidobacter denitrificans]
MLLIDIQYDFLPGGALAVTGGEAILAPIRELLESCLFDCVVATQDWHPAGHVSFASSHAGRTPFEVMLLHGREQVLWPDHCIAGTRGAALHDSLPLEHVDAIIRKGTDPKVDSYSGFRNNWDENGERPATGLAGYLRERGIKRAYVCGLARDFCVRWSAEDAADLGFEVAVIWDLTRSVNPAGDDVLRAALDDKNVQVIDSKHLASTRQGMVL